MRRESDMYQIPFLPVFFSHPPTSSRRIPKIMISGNNRWLGGFFIMGLGQLNAGIVGMRAWGIPHVGKMPDAGGRAIMMKASGLVHFTYLFIVCIAAQ